VDFWLLRNVPFEQEMFSRRRHVSILGVQAWIALPEDVILHVRFAMNGGMILKNDLGGDGDVYVNRAEIR